MIYSQGNSIYLTRNMGITSKCPNNFLDDKRILNDTLSHIHPLINESTTTSHNIATPTQYPQSPPINPLPFYPILPIHLPPLPPSPTTKTTLTAPQTTIVALVHKTLLADTATRQDAIPLITVLPCEISIVGAGEVVAAHGWVLVVYG